MHLYLYSFWWGWKGRDTWNYESKDCGLNDGNIQLHIQINVPSPEQAVDASEASLKEKQWQCKLSTNQHSGKNALNQ